MSSATDSKRGYHEGRRWGYGMLVVLVPVLVVLGLLSLTATQASAAHRDAETRAPAAPIPPPEGYPKLSLSTKRVAPTLAHTGGVTLTYAIEIRNTGATTASHVTLTDPLPDGVTALGEAWASAGAQPALISATLVWTGEVGFDRTVLLTFNVGLNADFSGTLCNTAVISDPHITRPVTVSAETVVTDDPILAIAKTSAPAKPGANKPLHYALQVTNVGQPMQNQPITVTDEVPLSTTLRAVGPDGVSDGDTVTWTRAVTLALGQSTAFTFSVDVGDVPSGTVITNQGYAVVAPFGVTAGEPYTVTIVDPIFALSKQVWPDPPGANREMTYTLTLRNVGSLATGLTITDRVPSGVTYVGGGTANLPVVHWALERLDTGESARFTYTVYISDVMNVPIVNDDYWACCAEGVCAPGKVLTKVVRGPRFEAYAAFDPIVKSPGGSFTVTPTLVVRNLGPGNALDATALLQFIRVKANTNGVEIIPAPAVPWEDVAGECGDKCVAYSWTGDVASGETLTFTTKEGRTGSRGVSTVGGEEGEVYTASIVITDNLTTWVQGQPMPITTQPVTGTAVGKVTHYASLEPVKTGPRVVGRGRLMTYTLSVVNTGQSTVGTPVLTDVVPMSTTFVWASDGGVSLTISDTVMVSWTLPPFSTGASEVRRFAVRVDDDLVSGTQIVNADYAVGGYDNISTGTLSVGPPLTTTVQEVGLIDSFKTMTPQLSLPGPGNVLTFEVHLVNSSALTLTDVTAHDVLPWADSTYRRDAVVSAGELVSDIVSIDWQGDIPPVSSVVLTGSVLVDAGFEGALTNTVTISHPDLLAPVERHAVAYITTQPVLSIQKSAQLNSVALGERLNYQLWVTNLGQGATALVVTDVLPANVTYVPDSASGDGALEAGAVRWEWPVLAPGERIVMGFEVTVTQGVRVVNDQYAVRSAEGSMAWGDPVITAIEGGGELFLPLVLRTAP